MAYTSPRTWVSSEVVTAALLNTHVRDNFIAIAGTAGHGWTSWTPTVTQSGAVTVTVTAADYATVGPIAHVQATLVVTGSGSGGTVIQVGGIPAGIAASRFGNYVTSGSFSVLDSGSIVYTGSVINNAAQTLLLQVTGYAGYLGNLPNFALASGDAICFSATWRTA